VGLDHLAGEERADGVRDGVVDVEEIERVELGDLGHSGGEGEIVRRVLEERVVGDSYFVEVDVGLAAGEAEGLRVGDEVDLVTAGGELDSELGGDYSGAAVGGVAGDAYLHKRSGASDAVVRLTKFYLVTPGCQGSLRDFIEERVYRTFS
jgi:hypothetical protein